MIGQAPLLQVDGLVRDYHLPRRSLLQPAPAFRALHGVGFTVEAGRSFGVVGESGCGKSTVALAVMQYMGSNGRVMSGEIKFKGRDLTAMSDDELRQLRGSQIAMVYQEPMASLNPSMKSPAPSWPSWSRSSTTS